MTLDERVRAAFVAAFGGRPDGVARAPGRVNLIGEHTDYNDGFVLPVAIAAETRVAFRARADRQVRVVACDMGAKVDAFDLALAPFPDGARDWRDYVRGTIGALSDSGIALGGVDLAIAGDVPRGAGLSSSASLEVAVGLAVCTAASAAVTPLQLALAGQRAENEFVGVRCGIMDQLAAAASMAGAASLIDCRTLTVEPVPFPETAAIVIVQSGVERGLVAGHYNRRRAECEEAACALGVAALRDATLVMLAAGRARMSDTVYRRARHVITENDRVLAAAELLAVGDLAGCGRLMAESHASMRDDFAITVPPIDQLAAIANTAVAECARGQGGARMTGGGFGGAVVVVAPTDQIVAVTRRIARDYCPPNHRERTIMIDRPEAGASLCWALMTSTYPFTESS